MICKILGFCLLSFGLSMLTPAQQRCGYARDFVVQAREKSKPNLTRTEMQMINSNLERATEMCPGLADGYYYRHLYEKHLGNQPKANLMKQKAAEFGSEALQQGVDPFAISAPSMNTGITVSKVVREKWALVIGISDFQFKSNKLKNLSYPAKDANDFATLLKTPTYGRFKNTNVRVLTNESATTKEIKAGINWLARSAQKDDLVVIFLSSHGSPREADTTGKVSYVITYDTDVSSADSLYGSALPMQEIVEAMSFRIAAQRGVMFLDTCFSGEAASGLQAVRNYSSVTSGATSDLSNSKGSKSLQAQYAEGAKTLINQLNYGIGRVVITASQPDEQSWESDKIKNGYFTFYLIKALMQNNGTLSLEQLYNYLKVEVSNAVMNDQGKSQVPMMSPLKPPVEIILGGATQN